MTPLAPMTPVPPMAPRPSIAPVSPVAPLPPARIKSAGLCHAYRDKVLPIWESGAR